MRPRHERKELDLHATKHKSQHHDLPREIPIGPKAQAIIKEFLKADVQAFLFSPSEAEAERREKLHEARKTPLSCGNGIGSNRTRRPERRPKDRYTVNGYRLGARHEELLEAHRNVW